MTPGPIQCTCGLNAWAVSLVRDEHLDLRVRIQCSCGYGFFVDHLLATIASKRPLSMHTPSKVDAGSAFTKLVDHAHSLDWPEPDGAA